MNLLVKIINTIMKLIFSKPQLIPYDQEKKYHTILNNFIIKIFYEVLYTYVNNKEIENHTSGDYYSFLQLFKDDDNKIVNKFYKEVIYNCLVKMSPIIRGCYYRIYSGLVPPEIEIKVALLKKETEIETKSKFKKLINFIKTFKLKTTYNEIKISEPEIKNDVFEAIVDTIGSSEPGLSEYITRYVDALIKRLGVEAEIFFESSKLSSDEYLSISKETNKKVTDLQTVDFSNIKSKINNRFFIERYYLVISVFDLTDDIYINLFYPDNNKK